MGFLSILFGPALLVFILVASLVFLFGAENQTANETPREPAGPRQRPRGRRGRMRERRRGAARQDDSSGDSEEDDDGGDWEQEEDQNLTDRQRRINAYEEKRRARDAEREAQEEKEEAELLKQAEERRQQEEAEAEKWSAFITVEETGHVEEDNEQDLLDTFVETIKARKIVALEDLAVEFKIRTQDVIQRIDALEQQGRLTGVMDDRGKYLYLDEEEMRSVADYIVRQGRVSISDLASVSHRLVDLVGKS